MRIVITLHSQRPAQSSRPRIVIGVEINGVEHVAPGTAVRNADAVVTWLRRLLTAQVTQVVLEFGMVAATYALSEDGHDVSPCTIL